MIGQENIIPNHSFELYSPKSEGWFYNGGHFTEVVKYWSSPTPASPDAYAPGIKVPKRWKEKGFGSQLPFDKKAMVGLTLVGCKNGKPHCKEYIQIRLAEPMVVGQRYSFSFWLSHMKNTLLTNNIGALFSIESVQRDIDELIDIKPHFNIENIVSPEENSWVNISRYFVADQPYEFLTIGNFYSDEDTKKIAPRIDAFRYAYYYIDEIILKKAQPILEVTEVSILEGVELKEGELIKLDNIYFDHDKADFLVRSYNQLDHLVDLMKRNENMIIEIQGHTDNLGRDDYNINLSLVRAKAVANYLYEKGIAPERASFKGFGSYKPLADNSSKAGRKANRRVEFLILKNNP
jgi:outer membrane protein OmpA-like peptidoglycan-associated protein